MNPPIVADAGPLIALASVGLLSLLRDLYGRVMVPPRVWAELRLDEERPGSRGLAGAAAEGWLTRVESLPAVFGLRPRKGWMPNSASFSERCP